MIIEDHPQLNQIYELALREDFETVSFRDGKPALVYMIDSIPALIVVDLHLSSTTGDQVLKAVHEDKRLQATKVILTTADVQRADMLYEQADIVLLKPVSPVQLRDLAKRLCYDY